MKMKVNKHVTRVVAGSVSTSILMSSCIPSSGSLKDLDDSIYGYNSNYGDLGKIAIPLLVKFTKDQAQYLTFLQKLANDIVNHPSVAKTFADNPDVFFKHYGYSEKINLDDDLLKIILTLGDEDINEAIKANDVKLFINLCIQKGLLSHNNSLIIANDDEIAKKIKELGLDLPSINQLEAGLALVVLITIILAVAIVINVTAIETKIGGPESPNIYAMQYLSDNYPTLNVWFMKQKDQKNTFYLLDEFNNHLIDNMIEAIKENNPSYFETHPEGDLKDFFKLNTMLYHR